MKKFKLGETDAAQYAMMSEDEKKAWLHPEPSSYHSFHIERLGSDLFRWRDSKTGFFYIGAHFELAQELYANLSCRKLDPDWSERAEPLRLLSDAEVDDLFADL